MVEAARSDARCFVLCNDLPKLSINGPMFFHLAINHLIQPKDHPNTTQGLPKDKMQKMVFSSYILYIYYVYIYILFSIF